MAKRFLPQPDNVSHDDSFWDNQIISDNSGHSGNKGAPQDPKRPSGLNPANKHSKQSGGPRWGRWGRGEAATERDFPFVKIGDRGGGQRSDPRGRRWLAPWRKVTGSVWPWARARFPSAPFHSRHTLKTDLENLCRVFFFFLPPLLCRPSGLPR